MTIIGIQGMTKDEAAKVYAIKYVLDYNTFRRSDRLKEDLIGIHVLFGDDKSFNELFEKYCEELRTKQEVPRWARMIMAERYSLNV